MIPREKGKDKEKGEYKAGNGYSNKHKDREREKMKSKTEKNEVLERKKGICFFYKHTNRQWDGEEIQR